MSNVGALLSVGSAAVAFSGNVYHIVLYCDSQNDPFPISAAYWDNFCFLYGPVQFVNVVSLQNMILCKHALKIGCLLSHTSFYFG